MTQTRLAAPARVASTTRLLRPLRAVRTIGGDALATAVHGLVIFIAIMGATFVADYPAWKMLALSVGGIGLFWSAHVYSAVLGHRHTAAAPVSTTLATVSREAARALPLLEACIAPLIPLLMAAIGIIPVPVAYWLSLTISLIALSLVGFLTVHNRQASIRRSLLASLTTASFGAAIIAAETFLH